MLQSLAVVRSPSARALFLGSAALSLGVLLLADNLSQVPSSRELASIFRFLFEVGDSQGAACALGVLAIAALLSTSSLSVRPVLRWVGNNHLIVAITTFIVLSLGSLVIYQNSRLSMDEYAQFFQSQVFAAGHISGQFPTPLINWLIPQIFQGSFFNVSSVTGAISSGYWPSFALLMTPFTWLGIPWACNPTISALTVLTLHRLADRLFDSAESAGLVVLLTLASPVFFGDGISYYSMPAHMLANCAFTLLLIDVTPRRALIAGLLGSVALTIHNPVPHLAYAIPWIISIARRPGGLPNVLLLLAGYIPLCLYLGIGWFLFSSHLAHEGFTLAHGQTGIDDSFSQIVSIVSLPTAGILLARVIGLAKLWTWSVPGLLLVACYGSWKWRANRNCVLIGISALLTFFVYFLVPVDQGHGWGYRYFHSAWFALPILAAAALANPAKLDERYASDTSSGPLAFIFVCALLSMLAGTGLRAYQMRQFIGEHERQTPQYHGSERHVEILDPRGAFYGADLVQNDPWLRGNVIRMITRGGASDLQMMHEQFPEMHQVYHDRYGSVWSAK